MAHRVDVNTCLTGATDLLEIFPVYDDVISDLMITQIALHSIPTVASLINQQYER